nr:reverse transcriptase domain-containing protein [Tanacetum cinerariifolium]
MFGQFMKMNTASSSGTGSLPSNTIPNPREDLKAITTQSGVTLARPSVSHPPLPSKEVDQEPETITNQLLTGSTNNVLPLVVQPSPTFTFSTPISSSKMPEVTKDTKLLEKLGDPDKFLIPRDFLEFDECLAMADLGTSINLMPLSIWKKISLPELTSTQMILELADRSITRPAGIAKDVFVKVGKFHFPTDFVVIDYVVDPRISLILGRPFLRIGRALIDVYGEELTLHVDNEAITFKVGQTSKYSYNDAESINRVDVIDVACEEYVQEVLGFSDNSKSGLPELTSTQMILELADRSITRPAGIAKDVFVKVGNFHFPTDFVVIDYVVDPRISLILRRPFLRIGRALIDVYGEELTLRVDNEAITFKVGQTSKYSYNDAESINRVDVIDVACEEYVQEVLGFYDNSKSGNPTSILDPIIALSSPSLTPFEGGDFILE